MRLPESVFVSLGGVRRLNDKLRSAPYAILAENTAHKLLKNDKIKNEWFNISADFAAAVVFACGEATARFYGPLEEFRKITA